MSEFGQSKSIGQQCQNYSQKLQSLTAKRKEVKIQQQHSSSRLHKICSCIISRLKQTRKIVISNQAEVTEALTPINHKKSFAVKMSVNI